MINLIPQQAKKRLLTEYWMRVGVVWGFTWSAALAVGVLVLVPTYFLIGYQVAVYETTAVKAVESIADYKQVSEELIRTSEEARIVVDEGKLPSISTYLELIEGMEGTEISLNSIDIGRLEDGFRSVVIQGVASDRRALRSFRDRLQASEQIAQAELPLSNLAQDKNIAFSLNVTLVDTQL